MLDKEFYRNLINQCSDLMIEVTRDMIVTEFNLVAAESFGIPIEAMLNNNLFAICQQHNIHLNFSSADILQQITLNPQNRSDHQPPGEIIWSTLYHCDNHPNWHKALLIGKKPCVASQFSQSNLNSTTR